MGGSHCFQYTSKRRPQGTPRDFTPGLLLRSRPGFEIKKNYNVVLSEDLEVFPLLESHHHHNADRDGNSTERWDG